MMIDSPIMNAITGLACRIPFATWPGSGTEGGMGTEGGTGGTGVEGGTGMMGSD
jgi:hypothetical protein